MRLPPPNERQTARVHNPVMSGTAEPPAPPDKQTLRRQFRARRRSLAPERDRGADVEAIAAAASVFLDTLALPPQGSGTHPAYGSQPCVCLLYTSDAADE